MSREEPRHELQVTADRLRAHNAKYSSRVTGWDVLSVEYVADALESIAKQSRGVQ